MEKITGFARIGKIVKRRISCEYDKHSLSAGVLTGALTDTS